MAKTIFTIPLLLLFFLFFLFPKNTLADHTIDDSVFKIAQSPEDVSLDSGQVTFTITTTQDFFVPEKIYSFNTWQTGDSHHDTCFEEQPGSTTLKSKASKVTTDNPRQLDITSVISDCRKKTGDWHLEVWPGESILNRNENTLIIKDWPFTITQAGGRDPKIEPVYPYSSTYFGLSATSSPPRVRLYNTTQNSWYTFWWDALLNKDTALRYQASENDIIELDLEKNGTNVNWTEEGIKYLCMEVGNYSTPINVTCKYKIAVNFKHLPPPPPPPEPPPPPPDPTKDCVVEILSAHDPPIKNDAVGATVSNLPINEEFHANLTPPDPPKELIRDTASAKGKSEAFFVSQKIEEGNYKITVTDKSNKVICEKKLQVGKKSDECTGECKAKAGGQTCTLDDKNPGIKTAIGCIHTNPVALSKDLLTFGIGIGGGLSFLMMLFGAFQMMTSAGNPETLNTGRQRLTSAIIGLLFIILSILFLQIIGWNILKLPGFGTK